MERNILINRLLLPIGNQPSINRASNIKLKNILIFNVIIIIIISLYLFYYYCKINSSFNKNINNIINYSENESLSYKTLNDIEKSNFKSFSSKNFYQITKERYLYEMQKQSIISSLISYKYSGIWESYNDNKDQSSFFIGNSNKGDAIFEFEKAYEVNSRQEAIALIMKNNEDKYIDHWLQFTSYTIYNALYKNVDILKNTFQISGTFLTEFEKGENFDTTYIGSNRCFTIINMTFPLVFEDVNGTLLTGENVYIGKIPIINTEKFTLIINSNCGFKFKVEAKIYNINEERKIKVNKLKIYLYLCTFSTILYFLGVFSLIYGIKKTEMAISALNIECFVMISVWNFYSFSSNIFLAFYGYLDYFFYFSINALISISKFLICDTIVFYTFWGIKEIRITNECQLFKLKLRFYISLVLFFISTFFLMPYFLINYFYISIICIILWVPQIIHNILTNNRYGLPFIYILGCTVDRIIYPFYFRGYKDNFFMLRVNNNIFKIIIFFVAFLIVIIMIQTFRGPRFMLSEKYQEYTYNFYKNKDELDNQYKDINNEECVICLMPIFEEGNYNKVIEMEEINNSTDLDKEEDNEEKLDKQSDIKLNINENKIEDSLVKNEEDFNNNDDNNLLIKDENNRESNIEIKESNNNIKDNKGEIINAIKSKNEIKMLHILKNVLNFISFFFKENFFYFYKSSANIHNKLYMLTPCKHIFHSECLEKWLDQKKECPNCRTSFENLV